MDLEIYIPTRGRVGYEKQITLREFEKNSNWRPVIVCPPDEVERHNRYAEFVVGCPHEGIGPTRQWILEQATTPGVVMFDDDMYFSKRQKISEPVPLERCLNLDPMIDWISDQLDAGFVHGGISARQGNNHIPRPFVDCIRVNNAHFFHAPTYRELGLRFDKLPVMEDFYVTLNLLTKGYANRVAYHYCWSQRGSGTQGGCSLYRTGALQATAAHQLAEWFPGYVKVVTKTSTSGGKLFSGDRVDVNISWLKAWGDRDCTRGPEPTLARR